jgi:hypothetical protein
MQVLTFSCYKVLTDVRICHFYFMWLIPHHLYSTQYFFISAYILCETAVQNIRHKIIGTETKLGARDSALFNGDQNGSETHSLKGTADSTRCESGRCRKRTTHLHPLLWLIMRGLIFPLPLKHSLRAQGRYLTPLNILMRRDVFMAFATNSCKNAPINYLRLSACWTIFH